MPFSTKQSDIFYNDETKEMFVCTVSAITAAKCETGETIYGAVPIVHKIHKDDNYKEVIYPPNFSTFSTDVSSDIYDLLPSCPVDDLNFDSITKPLVNFNKDTSRYSVTFLGRFASDVDGLVVNNFIFEDVDNKFHLLNAKSLLPQSSLSAINGRFTFDSGYLNSDLYVGGNTVRNKNSSWFNPTDAEEIERSPNYMVGPTYVQSTSSLGFNLIQDQTNTAVDAITADKNFPFLYNGGYITINPKYVAFDPQHNIRIDFRARSFNVPSPTAYSSTQSTGTSATRWIQQYDPDGAGEGFCVYLFKQPEVGSYVVPNGVATTLGYSPADFNTVEVAGAAQTTVGLFARKNWHPNLGMSVGSSIADGEEADSFLGIGFDIGGNFASTSEDKPGWYDGTTYTAAPCSVAVRGNRSTNNKVLTAVELSSIPGATSIPLHTSASDAVFVDYRIDLTNKGNRLTVFHKLTSSTDYSTILDLRLNKIQGTGAGNEYSPWAGIASNQEILNNNYPLLNVGLSFTTSTKASQFELASFEVKGVRVKNPWKETYKDTDAETTDGKTQFNHIEKSSENLRKRMLNVDIDEDVDLSFIGVQGKNTIASELYEASRPPEITLCSDDADIPEQEVDITYTGISSKVVDDIVQATERGEILPEYGGNTILRGKQKEVIPPLDLKVGEPIEQVLPTAFDVACATAVIKQDENYGLWMFRSFNFTYNKRTYKFFIRGLESKTHPEIDTLTLYRKNIQKLEERWIEAVTNNLDELVWELHQVDPKEWTSHVDNDYTDDTDSWFWLPKVGFTQDVGGTGNLASKMDEFLMRRTREQNPHTVCVVVPDLKKYKGDTEDVQGTASKRGDTGEVFNPGTKIFESGTVVSDNKLEEVGAAPDHWTVYEESRNDDGSINLNVKVDWDSEGAGTPGLGQFYYLRGLVWDCKDRGWRERGRRVKANGVSDFSIFDIEGVTDVGDIAGNYDHNWSAGERGHVFNNNKLLNLLKSKCGVGK